MAIGKKKLEQKGPSVDDMMDATTGNATPVVITNKDALVPMGDGTFKYKRFKLTRMGLDAPKDVTEEELDDIGYRLSEISKTIGWWIGDWANLYPGAYGETYKALADKFGLSEHTVENKAWLCRSIENSRRREKLTEGHHDAVARLDPKQQDKLLQQAIDEGWTVKQTRQAKKMLLSGKSDEPTPFDTWYKSASSFRSDLKKMKPHERENLLKEYAKIIQEYGIEL